MNHMYGGSQKFFIRKEHAADLLEILSTYCDKCFDSLVQAFDHLDWRIGFDTAGNITDLYHEYGRYEDEDYWLNLIAPFVEPGSYISMENDDDYRWAWYFDGKTCTEYAGDTYYYLMPDHSRTFTDERDPETVIPISQLKREYAQHILDDSIDPAEVTFTQYLSNCMSDQGGTLTEVK